MTPDDPIRPARGGHPADEDLSALLDGDAGVDPHVRRCARCRDRLSELRSVAEAVAAPVPLPAADVREAAIARAVDAAGRGRSSGRVVWLEWWRRPAFAGGAVAAAVAAVLAFALLPNRQPTYEATSQNKLKSRVTTTNGSQADAASGAVENQTAAGGAAPAARPASPNGGMAFTVGGLGRDAAAPAAMTDLGDIRDGAALRERVGPAVHRRRSGDQEASTLAAPADQRAGEPQPAAAPAAGGTAGNAASGPGEPPPPYSGAPPACEQQARAQGPATDRLVYVATARWQDTPSVVLAFVPEPPASGPARVYVMAQGDCRLLFSDAYEQ